MVGKYLCSLSTRLCAAAALCIGQLMLPVAAQAQQVLGQASAVRATVLGATTVLADTGTLSGSSDAREASQLAGSVASLLSAETLRASTIGYPDQVDSEASLTGLNLSIAGLSITADAVMARAFAFADAAETGLTNLAGLSIGGLPVNPTGEANQIISLGILTVVLNEQIPSAGGITVNALRIKTVDGLNDIVIGSATAAIPSASSGVGSGLLGKLL
jgi:hypothetical protein